MNKQNYTSQEIMNVDYFSHPKIVEPHSRDATLQKLEITTLQQDLPCGFITGA